MNRTLLIAQREFLENMRTKGFWIGILMLPIMLAMVAVVPLLVESMREAKPYTVIDHSGWLLPVIQQEIEAQDLAIFMQTIRSYESIDETPKAWQELHRVLEPLDEEQVHAIAFRSLATLHFSASYDHIELPPSALAYLQRYGRQLAVWWTGLSAEQRAKYTTQASTSRFRFVAPDSLDPAQLNKEVQQGKLSAYFVIGKHPIRDNRGARYVSNNLTDTQLKDWFSDIVSRHIRRERLRQEDMTPVVAAWINEPVDFKGVQVSDNGEEQAVEVSDIVRQWTPVAFVYLLWISIMVNTQMLLTNTIEEKSNRLIEVLLSSVSAIALLAGKITGIAATGLAMICAWSLMGGLFILLLPEIQTNRLPIDFSSIAGDPWLLGSFLLYFVLGYLFYAALLVGLGSTCNNLKEAQNLMLPVQLIQMIPIFVMIPIGRDPNGPLAHVLSYIPPLTPFVMMNRAAVPPSLTEYVITTLLLVASIAVALWFAARIFRIGILSTGTPPSLMEILRWLRAPASNPV